MLAQLVKVMPSWDALEVERWGDNPGSMPERPRPLYRLEKSEEPPPLRLLQESRF